MEEKEYKLVIEEMKNKLLGVLSEEHRYSIEFDEECHTEEQIEEMVKRYDKEEKDEGY